MSNARLESEIKKNIKFMNETELSSAYGIFLNSDGSVFDDVNSQTFKSIDDWVHDYLNDTGVEFEKFQTSFGFDDDYY